MSDGILSQEEIDALLRSDTFSQEAESGSAETPSATEPALAVDDHRGLELTDMEKDAVGEVANIVMGSSATALSAFMSRKVEITTPRVELTDPDTFRQDYPLPYLLVNVEYISGLEGSNVLIVRDKDACVMADLMMGSDGSNPPAELDEIHLSAISEAMNQMAGSSATAMSTILNDRIDITPPTLEVINFATDELKGSVGQKGKSLVKVAFRMTVDDLIDSEIMQLIPVELAKNMVRTLMEEMSADDIHDDVLEGLPQNIVDSIPETMPDPAPRAPEPVTMPAPEPVYQTPPPMAAAPAPTAATAEAASFPPQPAYHPSYGGPSPVMQAGGTPVPVQPVQFAPLQPSYQNREISNIDLIMDVPLQITVELGKTRKTIREILALGQGSVVELDKLAGEPVDLMVNGKLLAKGEVVVIDENFGIRVTDIINPIERVTNLQ